jgi:hypothetical protein
VEGDAHVIRNAAVGHLVLVMWYEQPLGIREWFVIHHCCSKTTIYAICWRAP